MGYGLQEHTGQIVAHVVAMSIHSAHHEAHSQGARRILIEQDAQAGDVLQREKVSEGNQLQLTGEERQEMLRILEQQPVVNQSDIILPNTLMV